MMRPSQSSPMQRTKGPKSRRKTFSRLTVEEAMMYLLGKISMANRVSVCCLPREVEVCYQTRMELRLIWLGWASFLVWTLTNSSGNLTLQMDSEATGRLPSRNTRQIDPV